MNDYDLAMEMPYIINDAKEDEIEEIAQSMLKCQLAETSPYEFFSWLAEEPENNQLVAAFRQRDFEAIGGILYDQWEAYLYDGCIYQARRNR